MSYVLIVAFIMRTGPDAITTQASFVPARYYMTYDECMNDSKAHVEREMKAHTPSVDNQNVVVRYACVPVTDSK